MNKNSFINTLLLSCLLITLAVGDQCFNTLLESDSYTCSTPLSQRNYDTSSLQLNPSVREITVKFDIKLTDLCATLPSTELSYFAMTITPSGGVEKKIGEMRWTENSRTQKSYSEDLLGASQIYSLPMTTSLLNIWATYYFTVSFDTGRIGAGTRNKIEGNWNNNEADFGDWNFSTLKFYLCADSTGTNLLGCEVSNFKAAPVYSDDYYYLVSADRAELIGDYRFDDSKIQYSVNDYSNTIGPAYLGLSSTDPTNAPTWLPSVKFVLNFSFQ
jgi:hypothetical protein